MRAAILFGKLPAHGDFVARGLSETEAGALDDWLSESLGSAAVMRDFDNLYVAAPSWRFVASFDDQPMCGVIAPSVDKVGRQFPILVGVQADGDVELIMDACESRLYEAFADGHDADNLYGALTAFPEAGGGNGVPAAGWFLEDENRLIVDRLDGDRPSGLVRRMVESARLRA